MKHLQRASYERAHDQLVSAINSGADGKQIGEDLFGAADLLSDSASLRDALTDPARSVADRTELLDGVFKQDVAGAALEVMSTLLADHWTEPVDYSKALEDLGLASYILTAMRGDEYDSLCQELVDVQTLVRENRDLRVQLSAIGDGNAKARAELATKIFEGHVSPIALRLIARAAYSAKYGQLVQVLRQFAERAARATNRLLVIAYTAKPLSEEQYYRLTRLAGQRWSSAILLTTVIEPDLIGGFRLDGGDEAVDTTVRRDLQAAKALLTR